MKKKIVLGAMMVVLCLSVTGCASSDYKKATDLQTQGEYQQALDLYKGISDYKDAKSKQDECQKMLDAIASYDEAKAMAEEKNTALDTAIKAAENLIAKKETPLDELLIQILETAISDTKAAKVDVPVMAKTEDEINASVTTMNAIDYTKALENLATHQGNLEKSIKQYALVNNPDEKYIIKCLKKVKAIKDISAVTEDNDPNGNLGKPGGYTSQVYFSCKWVDQSDFLADEVTVIDKGTDCGGSIEVYETEEYANKREEYLAGYDGGIFASGSHKVIGTVLVRTSDKLPASKQKKLEEAIIKQLIMVE